MRVSKERISSRYKAALVSSLAAFVLSLSSSVSSAALVTYNYTGVWDVYQYNPGGLGYQDLDPATVGANFSGTVTLDTSYPDWHPGPYNGVYITPPGYPGTFTLDFGRHDQASSHYTASLNGVYVNTDGQPNGFNESWGEMWYAATGYGWPQTIDGVAITGGQQFVYSTLQINLINGDNSNDGILPDPFNTFGGSYVLFLLHGENLVQSPWEAFAGRITSFSPAASEVPLPAALPLLAAGLGAMGFMGWRRKRNA